MARMPSSSGVPFTSERFNNDWLMLAFAAAHGAAVLRVHDVRETSDMVKMLFSIGDFAVRR